MIKEESGNIFEREEMEKYFTIMKGGAGMNGEEKFWGKMEEIAYEMKNLSVLAVDQYEPIVNMVLSGYITGEDEIAHIMDEMLDFCQFDNMLQLFKKLCRGIYHQYPSLVADYIMIYKELWDSDEDDGEDSNLLYMCSEFK